MEIDTDTPGNMLLQYNHKILTSSFVPLQGVLVCAWVSHVPECVCVFQACSVIHEWCDLVVTFQCLFTKSAVSVWVLHDSKIQLA